MRRRAFIRTVTGVFSAAVFTSTGWLMGTRTLTMGGPQMPPPDVPCDFYCAGARSCVTNASCASAPHCDTWDYYWYTYNQDCRVSQGGYDCFAEVQRGSCDCTPCREP